MSTRALLGIFIVTGLIVCNASASDSLILKAGTVLVGNGTALKNVVVVIKEEKIDFIGKEYPIRKGTQILDYSKSIITPGFIAANATLKVVKHTNEEQFESTPEMNLLYSINPQAKDFEKAWRSGVTCVYLAPGNLNVINGTGTILKTVGKTPQQMLLRNQVHMKVTLGKEPALGNSPPRRDPIFLRTRRPQNRMGIIFVFRSEFINLQNKRDVSESLLSAQEILLRNVLEGEIPLRIRARSYIDIKSAFRMMQEFGYHWILEDGVDAYRYLDDLKRHKIPVIYGPVYKLKGGRDFNRENDLYLAVTPILLDREGILFAFQNNDWSPISSLRDEAMYAVELGMTKDSALKALTMNAAKILGVEHRVGSLEKGKDADILIFNGDPLEPCSRLEQVIINGKLFDPNK